MRKSVAPTHVVGFVGEHSLEQAKIFLRRQHAACRPPPRTHSSAPGRRRSAQRPRVAARKSAGCQKSGRASLHFSLGGWSLRDGKTSPMRCVSSVVRKAVRFVKKKKSDSLVTTTSRRFVARTVRIAAGSRQKPGGTGRRTVQSDLEGRRDGRNCGAGMLRAVRGAKGVEPIRGGRETGENRLGSVWTKHVARAVNQHSCLTLLKASPIWPALTKITRPVSLSTSASAAPHSSGRAAQTPLNTPAISVYLAPLVGRTSGAIKEKESSRRQASVLEEECRALS